MSSVHSRNSYLVIAGEKESQAQLKNLKSARRRADNI